ncbi:MULTISPECIES: hypothetical protein [Agrobacterium]|uniref:Uncharacterized protein n=1 Tax=Agrobacterium larrymoorei TaxID=160699 RepID=A0ABX8TF82_9HYPH|nr:hypothetical protein [Agrobacterium larrymoorei]NSZ10078.1 hypothetical protein [Agrobacterium tumefaciens]QYA10808.1 hypothetical protein J5285_25990 [Agrobacterium larrymoorei]
MPFYLVTHTTLVEADNDSMAAQKAVDQICSTKQIKVVVTIDDTKTSHVVVPTGRPDGRLTASSHDMREDDPKPSVVEDRPVNPTLLNRISTWLTFRPNSR